MALSALWASVTKNRQTDWQTYCKIKINCIKYYYNPIQADHREYLGFDNPINKIGEIDA